MTAAGKNTFTYVPVVKILGGAQLDLPADFFKNKIVVLGTTAQGTYDLKSSPLSDVYPGVEVQATAIENLIEGERVVPLSSFWLMLIPLACAMAVSAGVILPRRASIKLLAPLLTTVCCCSRR